MDRATFLRMLHGAAAQVRANHEMLSRLDSCGGDGDHGTTMLRAVTVLEKVLDTSATTDIQGLLQEVGWAILGVDGGATGPLLGTFFLGMAEAAAGRSPSMPGGLLPCSRRAWWECRNKRGPG